MTRLQKAILKVVQESKEHLSAKEVYSIVQKMYPSVAMGTVYRNLNQFAEDKLIRRVSGVGASDYYEGNITPHNHALCISCGKIEDIEIPGMRDFIGSQINGKTVSLDLLVNIICSECSSKDINLWGTGDGKNGS